MQYGSHNWIYIIVIASVPVSWRDYMPHSARLHLQHFRCLWLLFPYTPKPLNRAPKHTGQVLGDNPLYLGIATRQCFCCELLRWEGVSSCAELTLRTFPWKRFCCLCFNIICKRVCFVAYNSVLALEKQVQICDQQSQNLSLVLLLQK